MLPGSAQPHSRCGGIASCSGAVFTSSYALRSARLARRQSRQRGYASGQVITSSNSSSSTSSPVAISAVNTPELGWRTDFDTVYTRTRLVGSGSFGQAGP